MSYLGNSPGQSSQRIIDTFNVGSTTATFTPSSGYTLGYLDVYLNGVKLVNGDDYTATNGTTFTLTSSAVSGDVVEAVAYIPRGLSDGYTKSEADAKFPLKPTGTATGSKFLRDDNSWQTVTAPSPTAVSDQANASTGYFDLPAGTTAQRPASPTSGATRWNTDLSQLELYDGAAWLVVKSQFSATGGTVITSGAFKYHVFNSSSNFEVTKGAASVKVLLVAGGGAGGFDVGGGGGAGGLLFQDVTVSVGTYSIVVGSGGTASLSGSGTSGSGQNTTGFNLTAIGGGGAGNWSGGIGASGGSGGGGTSNVTTNGSGTAGQGFAGGVSANNTGNINEYSGASGGGGAGGAGGNGTSSGWSAASSTYGYGGIGKSDSALEGFLSATSTGVSDGTTRYIAGGGGAGSDGGSFYGLGGKGGGGNGGNGANSGVANTGSGGGGAGGSPNNGGNGGSGIVIIRYPI